jgi:hypothetical protein
MARNKYGLGIALQKTNSHPWGKGAENMSPAGLVDKAEAEGISDKRIALKLQAIGNINHKAVFKEGATIARKRAHRKGEYKNDKIRM